MADNNGGESLKPVSSKSILTRVDAVHFEGLDRTKQDILRELVKPIFKTQDIGEVIQKTQHIRRRFQELGLFRNVQVSIDESPKPVGLEDDRSNVSITFDVEETRRYAGGIFTTASNNEASAILELRSPNLLGRGEQLQGRFEHSLKHFSSWSASFTKPLVKALWPSLSSNIDLSIAQSAKDIPWSGFKELDRSFFANLNIQQNRYNHHSLQWESSWRYLSSLDTNTSFKIREQLGHSLKSSISHVYTHDRRDHAILPTSGFMFKLLNEYAGFHKDGGVSFLKQEIELQQNVSLLNLILQGSFKFGILKPFDNVLVTDKFFLGGPLNLRGFQMNGVGPHNNGSALGANTYWVGGLHAYLPLPFKNACNEYMRVHSFLNAGTITDSTNYNQLLDNIRLSTGLGLVLTFGGRVRLEANYCWPIKAQAEDKTKPGFQFGIGINYI